MRILLALAALILGVPLVSYALYLGANLRAGLLPRVRLLCGGHLVQPLLRSVCNSAWSIVLLLLAYPLGWLPERQAQVPSQGILPPVILIHGLYHNASAWFLYGRRLRKSGFADVRTYAYASFFRPFEDIVEGLVQAALRAAAASPTGKVLLVGHSLGGLVVRSACINESLRGRVAGIVTLGTPHQGSTLAGLLALGQLGRGLRPGGQILKGVRRLPVCPGPALSLYSPTDNMVLPLTGSLLDEREKRAGWIEVCARPVSHVGLLFDGKVADLSLEFLLRAASCPASPRAWP